MQRMIVISECFKPVSLQWRQNEHEGFSNHHLLDYFLNRLTRCRWKKTSKLCVTGLCEGNPPVTGGFHSQRVNNAENISIQWRHHDQIINRCTCWRRTLGVSTVPNLTTKNVAFFSVARKQYNTTIGYHPSGLWFPWLVPCGPGKYNQSPKIWMKFEKNRASSQLRGCLCCSLFISAWIASFRSVGYWWYLLSKCRNTSGTSIWIYILEIFDGYEIIVKIVINKFEFLDKAFPTWFLSPNEFGLNAVPTEHQQTLAVG